MKYKITHSFNSYNVWIFSGQLRKYLTKQYLLTERNVFCIIDSRVYNYHWNYIKKSLPGSSKIIGIYKVRSSEKNKSLSEIEKIQSSLLNSGADRETIVLAVGGGIAGDIASFAASIYMRGVDYIHVPTTIVSMIDSSIGGKTGVNFKTSKNLVGTFFQPKSVFIDISFLKTLPVREINSSIGEIIKYSFLSGKGKEKLFNKGIFSLLSKDYSKIAPLIYECLKIKSAVVEKDEKEVNGLRKILNLGHTFAHGIESSSDFKVKHGEAVLLGIIASLFYSYKVKLISAEYLYESLLRIKPYIITVKNILKFVEKQNTLKYMRYDKKNLKKRIHLVLLSEDGRVVFDYPARSDFLKDALDDMLVWVSESFKKETVEK
jgi:3-dehydroquinate synthase